MKKILLAVSLAVAATAVQASPSLIIGGATPSDTFTTPFDPYNGTNVITLGYTSGLEGTLLAGSDNTSVEFTYLGQESGNINISFVDSNGVLAIIEENEYGAMYTSSVFGAGAAIMFGFSSSQSGGFITNGDIGTTDGTSIIFLDAGLWNTAKGTDFDWLVGYNDPATGSFDADDMVLGVKAVPVPAALPLMASALGMFGIARRRKSA